MMCISLLMVVGKNVYRVHETISCEWLAASERESPQQCHFETVCGACKGQIPVFLLFNIHAVLFYVTVNKQIFIMYP